MSPPPLNPAQREAVEHFTGPMLVLAAAGSGKTRVITHRVVRLIERGIPAKSIVALTFTNKAAAEMRERIAAALADGAAAKQLTISTFHSFGLGVLTRERANLSGGGPFTIFDQGDQLGCVKELLSRIDYGKRFDASVIVSRISNAKNAFTAPEEMPEREGDDYDAITKIVYPRYQAALKSFHAYDFDDLVCEVARVWRARPDILARWQEKCAFLLVDEYQDTNRAQLEVLRLLAGERQNLCVVGDDDQAIYGWRGADVRNILEFDEQFPTAKVVKLEQNYRSLKPILDVANSVIERRRDTKHRKVLFTDRPGGEKAQHVVAASPEAEAQWVAIEVRKAIRDGGVPPREIAVLYRSNGQAKAIEETLREQLVPHRVVGGQQFFERKEVERPPRVHEACLESRGRDQPPPDHELPATRNRGRERGGASARCARARVVALASDRARRRDRRGVGGRARGLQGAREGRGRDAAPAPRRASQAERSGPRAV